MTEHTTVPFTPPTDSEVESDDLPQLDAHTVAAIEAEAHACWDHAEPVAETQDFDYFCRWCGMPLRSDRWYRLL